MLKRIKALFKRKSSADLPEFITPEIQDALINHISYRWGTKGENGKPVAYLVLKGPPVCGSNAEGIDLLNQLGIPHIRDHDSPRSNGYKVNPNLPPINGWDSSVPEDHSSAYPTTAVAVSHDARIKDDKGENGKGMLFTDVLKKLGVSVYAHKPSGDPLTETIVDLERRRKPARRSRERPGSEGQSGGMGSR